MQNSKIKGGFMNFSIFKLLTLFLCFLSLCVFADAEIRDASTGVAFPSNITFGNQGNQFRLHATGIATRKKFFVKVYSIASYLQDGAEQGGMDKFQAIMQPNKAKQLSIKWLHDASAEQVQNGYRESFNKALSESQSNLLQNEIGKFIHFFNQNIQKGDEHILRMFPDGSVEVMINGSKVGTITNPEFGKGLWNIWFGERSVVDRNNLVSQMR